MNDAGQLCGIEESGQIVIRTPYSSLGYINLEAIKDGLTGSFIVNKDHCEYDMLYFTGDRGKFRTDGLLEIHGRMDDQVKISGVRIELGEIQSVVSTHPEVDACVVVVKGVGDDRRLVAYVVTKKSTSLVVSTLRDLVKEELPRYQHPSYYVLLPAFPLLPNGKVDRNALPEPSTDRLDMEDPYIAPRNEIEQNLTQIWEDLLNIKPIGIRDNFFDLGGHSFLAVHLMSKVNKSMDRALPLATLFGAATIEKLAQCLADVSEKKPVPLVAIQSKGRDRPLFFVHPAGGNVLCYSDLANQLGKEQPFYALQSQVSITNDSSCKRIEDMATEYLESIVKVQSSDPYLFGGWSMGGIVAYEMAQQLVRQGQEIALLAILDHQPPESCNFEEIPDEISLMRQFFENAVPFDMASLGSMGDEQRFAYFLKHARKLGLLPPDIDEKQVRSYLNVYKANILAVRRYSVKPYSGRITLLKAGFGVGDNDVTLGWDKFAKNGVEVFEVSGKHHEMVSKPYVVEVAKILKDCLAKTAVT